MTRILLSLVCAIVIAVAVLSARTLPEDTAISGPIQVVDGDTIDIGQTRIRLFGIDAVEHDQTCQDDQGSIWACGTWVAQQMRTRFDGVTADCHPTGDVTYGRIVARCSVDGADLQLMLVRDGLAFAYRRYATDYVAAEKTAAAKAVGLWASEVQRPAEFRAARLSKEAVDPSCRIKGNISASGNIFHLPGSEHYAGTRINAARGERWFCTVAEAEQAGWRAARG